MSHAKTTCAAMLNLTNAAQMLSAIGHPIRLEVFRALLQAGPGGIVAGEIAKRLALAPSSLNFHLRALQSAGLVDSRSEGRFVFYIAKFDAMSNLLTYLTHDCCGGNPCLPMSESRPRKACTAKPSMETQS